LFCRNCGVKDERGSKFCGECGAPLIDQQESTPVPPVQPIVPSVGEPNPAPKRDIWNTVRIVFVFFWTAFIVFARERFTAYGVGEWFGTLLLPFFLAYLFSRAWRTNRRKEFSFWFLGLGIFLPGLALHHSLKTIPRSDMLKELTGAKPLEEGLPQDEREIAAVTKKFFDDVKSFRASQDAEEAKIEPALATVDTAASFASPTAMQNCIDAVTQKLSLDRQTSEAIEGWQAKVSAQLDQTDLPADEKQKYLKGFSESFAGSNFLGARRKMMDSESQWADATVDLYHFSKEHAREISTEGDRIRIGIGPTRNEFNEKLDKAEQQRKGFLDQAKVVNDIRAANMKQAGVTQSDLK
jgi:hypothetical protein